MSDMYIPLWHAESEKNKKPKKVGNPFVKKYWMVIFIAFVVLIIGGGGFLVKAFIDQKNIEKEIASIGDTVPYGVKFVEVGSTSFTIEWKTKTPTIGFIKYGLDDSAMDLIGQAETNSGDSTISHKITVDGLDAGEKYYVEIHSNAQAYGEDGLPLTIRTLE